MPDRPILGWDIGGAHLKGVRLDPNGEVGAAIRIPCPLWQGPEHLGEALERAVSELRNAPTHAVTMTGELVDAFASRREGVQALVEAATAYLSGADIRIYAGPKGFLDPGAAIRWPQAVASANWHATAALAADRLGEGLLVDIGSTTSDLVPLAGTGPEPRGSDDASRLASGELVYTGIVRTPVLTLAERVPFEGEWIPLMAEAFATAADVHRITGELPEDADRLDTPDGAGKTPADSARRLARMVGRDVDSAPAEAWRQLAAYVAECQLTRLHAGAAQVLSGAGIPSEAPVVAAGAGAFLARRLAGRLGRPCRDLEEALGPSSAAHLAEGAPAVAVARLLAQEPKKAGEPAGGNGDHLSQG